MSSFKKILSYDIFYLLVISAIVFLPYSIQLSYYLDDWYYVYDGVVAGPNIFHSMFRVDRPIRGYFFDVFFSLFGPYPLPYHLGAYLWRLLAGFSAFWLLNIIWAENKRTNFLIALLFVLYPGYAWWVSAIEYQPMAVSLFLQIFSVLLTLLSIQSAKPGLKVIFAIMAVVTGWAYIALVDYAVGAEVFRFLCVYLLVSRNTTEKFLRRVQLAIKSSALYLSVAIGYVLWRVFVFESERHATDIDLHLLKFKNSPVDYVFQMGVDFYYSILNSVVNAWSRQIYLRLFDLGFNIPVMSWFLTISVLIFVVLIGFTWKKQGFFSTQNQLQTMPREAILIGFLSLSIGILPVIFFERFINLSIYSHYGLPVSFVSVIFLAGLICSLPIKKMQYVVFCIFIIVAALTHSLIAEKTLILKTSFENFWWQAAWRIPEIRPDTTLVTLYPYERVVDNDLGLPEAVNLIYFPEPRDENPIRYLVSTIMPTKGNIEDILAGKNKKTQGYRTHEMIVQYKNIVVLTQPNPYSCVRVIDGENFIFSEKDTESIKSIFENSKIDNVRLVEGLFSPPAYAFGKEPAQDWCYFFEKADLAVQGADWGLAAQFGDEAIARGLTPFDQTEWFPFIQAYSMTEDLYKVEFILKQVELNKFFNDQLCEIIRKTDSKFSPSLQMRTLIEEYSCQ